jgi:glycine/D-amino acid oxidase-like deaminating enzyme
MIVVVGAGIVGTATAWELARRGAPVTLLDRSEVSSGTTGLGEGNVLCADNDAGPELDLTVVGRAYYDQLEEELGEVARIRRKGALVVHPDEATWAAEPARANRLARAGVECELISATDVAAREPGLTGAIHGALHVPGDLQCDPRAIARALAARARELGAQVRTGAEVADVLVEDGRATGVRLADGTRVAADAVVLAAGPWTRPLAERAGVPLPLEPRKGQLIRLRLPAPDQRSIRHKVIDGGYLLAVADEGEGRVIATVVETTWDGHVIVGSSRERSGFDERVDAELGATLRARAARLFPALADVEIDDAWVGFRPWLPDGLPAIGRSRHVAGLWLATGHEGAGIALGPITGRVIAQQLTGEPTALDPAPFDPDRFAVADHVSRRPTWPPCSS